MTQDAAHVAKRPTRPSARPHVQLGRSTTAPLDAGLADACAHGAAASCEQLGDLYASDSDLRALDYYRSALDLYAGACHQGSAAACGDYARISAPGYGAHTYRSEDAP